MLNIGPQPNGELPATALERLKGMGQWMKRYGETLYGTTAGDVSDASWGVMTRKGNVQFAHILSLKEKLLFLPVKGKVEQIVDFDTRDKIKFERAKHGVILEFDKVPDVVDYIVEIKMK